MNYTNKMNILIVCPRLCHGGAERVAVCLANGFVERGHQVRFMTDLFEEQSYVLDNRVEIINLVATTKDKIRKWGSAIKIVRQETKNNRPDVIIGIMELCSTIAKIATIGMNIPVIATEHNSFERPESAPMSRTERFFKFHFNKIFDHVTVLAEADKTIIGKCLRNIEVMPNPLAIEPTNAISIKEKVVLAAGRVDNWHYKGFDIILQAWSKIMKNEENEKMRNAIWWLKIAGVWRGEDTIPFLTGLIPDGEWVYNDNVNDDDNTFNTEEKNTGAEKQNSQKSGVWKSEKYHIEFLGFQKDMESLYKKSEIFVLSSRYEAFGLVLIEAMSQGCAPIACDFKGRQREIIGDPPKSSLNMEDFQKDGIKICENGILCEPENVEALALALGKMMEDEEYRHQVQVHAIERSRFYDAEHTMNRWEKYLYSIINKQ